MFLNLAHGGHLRVQQAYQLSVCAENAAQGNAKCIEINHCNLTGVRPFCDPRHRKQNDTCTKTKQNEKTNKQTKKRSVFFLCFGYRSRDSLLVRAPDS